MDSLVSVVIPCYNSERWIGECIQSVLKQDYPSIEIIVVDDCSTDNSLKNALFTFEKQNHVKFSWKIISNLENKGECFTSAKGFEHVSGKYVCRLSSDDTFVFPHHLREQVRCMEKWNLDWCYNSRSLIGENVGESEFFQSAWFPLPNFISKYLWRLDNVFLTFPNLCYLIATRRNPVNSSAFMIRTDTYKKNLSWNSSAIRSCCDGQLLAKMFLLKLKGRAIHSTGSFYRIHPRQATGKPETNEDQFKMRRMMFEEIRVGKHPFWMKLFIWGIT